MITLLGAVVSAVAMALVYTPADPSLVYYGTDTHASALLLGAALALAKPHVALADWSDAIASRTYLLWGDGIHPQPAGARLYARVIAGAIRSTC